MKRRSRLTSTFYFLLSTFYFLLSTFSLSYCASTAPACTPVGQPQLLPAVPEASGVAQAAGALWTHNDSGAPVLFRIDSDRRVTPVVVTGAAVIDWEDIAAGSCGGAECLYIADIGDNRRRDSALRSTRSRFRRRAARPPRLPTHFTPRTQMPHTTQRPCS